jgi:ribonucleoside-triphosphate reductase
MKQEVVETKKVKVCGERTEVYSRVCGFFRPVSNYNKGKVQEFKDRKSYEI